MSTSLSSCTPLTGPSSFGGPVPSIPCDRVDAELPARVERWFTEQGLPVPDLPACSVVAPLYEVRPGSTSKGTCDINPRRKTITFEDVKMFDGCIVHEMGHATLHYIGSKCWNEFEHPGERCD